MVACGFALPLLALCGLVLALIHQLYYSLISKIPSFFLLHIAHTVKKQPYPSNKLYPLASRIITIINILIAAQIRRHTSLHKFFPLFFYAGEQEYCVPGD